MSGRHLHLSRATHGMKFCTIRQIWLLLGTGLSERLACRYVTTAGAVAGASHIEHKMLAPYMHHLLRWRLAGQGWGRLAGR